MPRARVGTPEGGTTEWRSELLADDFETWRSRDLADDHIQYRLLAGWYPKVRIGKRRVRVPVLVTLRVRADGERVVLDVQLVGDESTAAWRDVIHALVARHVGIPRLAVIDDKPGLAAALREQWPTLAIQRCTTHRLRNVEAKAPASLRLHDPFDHPSRCVDVESQ